MIDAQSMSRFVCASRSGTRNTGEEEKCAALDSRTERCVLNMMLGIDWEVGISWIAAYLYKSQVGSKKANAELNSRTGSLSGVVECILSLSPI